MVSVLEISAQDWIDVRTEEPSDTRIEILQSDEKGVSVLFASNGFYQIPTGPTGSGSYRISIPQGFPQFEGGKPDMEVFSTSVIVPKSGSLEWKFDASVFDEFENVELSHSQNWELFGDAKNSIGADPSVYNQDAFYPEELAQVSEPYILRNHRAVHIHVSPFQYNPVTKVLRMYRDITVQLKANNQNPGINELTSNSGEVGSAFSQIYRQHFLNYGIQAQNQSQHQISAGQARMLMVGPAEMQEAVQELRNWKARLGIETEFLLTDGLTAADLKAVIQSKYQEVAFSDLLILGDDDLVPTFLLPEASDWPYSCVVGSDDYPDVLLARLPVKNVPQLRIQIQKILAFERDMPIAYQDQFLFVSGQESVDFFQSEKQKLLQGPFRSVLEMYDGARGDLDASGDPEINALREAFNSGVGIVQVNRSAMLGNCGNDLLTASEINGLDNSNRFPVVWTSSCESGAFSGNTGDSQAELLMRSQATSRDLFGAIAVAAPSRRMEKKAAEPFYAAINKAILNNDNPTADVSLGALHLTGALALMERHSKVGKKAAQHWLLFGDPSLQIKTANPKSITAEHPKKVAAGSTSLEVVSNLAGSKVVVSKGDKIIDSYVGASPAVLNLSTLINAGRIALTISGKNHKPYLAELIVLPATGPYFELLGFGPAPGDSNGQADYSEELEIRVRLENIGADDADAVNLELISNDPYLEILEGSLSRKDFKKGTAENLPGFKVRVKNIIPDGHLSKLELRVKDAEGRSWELNPDLTLHAPKMEIVGFEIFDSQWGNGNNLLEPGEKAELEMEIRNRGTSACTAAALQLTAQQDGLLIITSNADLGAIPGGTTRKVRFDVLGRPNASAGARLPFIAELITGHYSVNKSLEARIAPAIEDFNTGDFRKFPWQQKGTEYWNLALEEDSNRKWVCQSGRVGDEQRSVLRILRNVKEDGKITFLRKVSSELKYDKLVFLIDGKEIDSWSGELGWKKVSYTVKAGEREFVWEYRKDKAKSLLSDAAWIDDVVFPSSSDDKSRCQAESGRLQLYSGPELGEGETLIVESSQYNSQYNQLYLLTSGAPDHRIVDWNDDGNFFPEKGQYQVLGINLDDDAFLSVETDYSVFDINGGCFDLDLTPGNRRKVGIYDEAELNSTPGSLPLELLSIGSYGAANSREVKFLSRGFEEVSYFIYDMTGRSLKTETLYTRRGMNRIELDIKSLPSGIYFVLIDNGAESVTGRMVKE